MYYCMYKMDENVCDCLLIIQVLIALFGDDTHWGNPAPLHEVCTHTYRVQCHGYHAHFINCMYVSTTMCVCQQDMINSRDVWPSVTKG